MYVIYVLVGFFVAPSILRSQIERRVSEQLKREVHVDRVAFNPLTLSLTIEKLIARDHDGQPLFGWGRFFVNLELLSILSDEIHFSEIELDAPYVRVAVSKQGILNVADIGLPASESDKSSKQWTLSIDRLTVNRARAQYTDESLPEPFSTTLGPSTFVLREFRTSGGPGAPGLFSATTEAGEEISWNGRVALAPLRSNGEVRVAKIALKKYAPFYSGMVQFDVLNGTIDAQAPYEFSIQNNKPQVKISEAAVQAQGVELAQRGQKEAIVSLKSFEVAHAGFDLQANAADVRQVTLAGARVLVRRDASGINLTRLMGGSTATSPGPRANAERAGTKAISGTIAEVAGKDLTISIEDQTTPRPASVELSHAAFSLKRISLADLSDPLPVEAHADLTPGGGTVRIEGTIAPQPLKADLTFAVEGVGLAALSPWVETFADVRLIEGMAGVRGKAYAAQDASGALTLRATADADVNLVSVNAPSGEDLVRWKTLAVHGVEYTSNPARLTVADISLADPEARLEMSKDHVLNVSKILRQPAKAAASAPAVSLNQSAPAGQFIAIDRVAIANGVVRFVDQSMDPRVALSVEQLSGTITGLTSAAIDRGDVSINGRILGVAPVSVMGKVNVLSNALAADVKLEVRNSDLLPLSPYVGKFVGYQLNSGELTLNTRAKVDNRKLDASNDVVITNFNLGAATNSPDAPHVPVHLAIALLRDADGKIALPIPVQGSLDDPNFAIGGVIAKVIGNLITKAATSPFTLIGAMFGGGRSGEDLSYADFAPGGAQIDGRNAKKLDVVAKALRERPGLQLDIRAGSDAGIDTPALREEELERRIRQAVWEDVRKVDPSLDSPDKVTVSQGAAARVIGLLYEDAFMQPPVEAVAAPTQPKAEAPKRRFFLFRWFTRSKPEPAPTIATPPKPAPSPVAKGKMPIGPVIGAEPPKPLPSVDEMRAKLLDAVPVGDQELRKLAADRADQVRRYLVIEGQVPAERVHIAASDAPPKGTRATLQLR